MNFGAGESPLEKSLVLWFVVQFMSFFPRKEMEGCFAKRWQGRNVRHNGNLKNLREAGATGEARWQICGLASVL